MRGWLRRWASQVLAVVVAVLVAIGVWYAFGSRLLAADIGGAALLIFAGALLLVYLMDQPWVRVGLAAVAYWIPAAAASGTLVTLFLLPPESIGVRSVATLVGLLAGTVVWLAATMFAGRRSTAELANGRAYAAVAERARGLEARIEWLKECHRSLGSECDEHMCVREAEAHLEFVVAALRDKAPSHGWATGAGYQGVWTAIHRADEALIGCLDVAGLRQEILRDRLRLSGSKLDEDLSAELVKIENRMPNGQPPPEAVVLRELAGRLQVVRRAINEFLDGRWDGLVNARAALSRSTVITAWVAYALAALAITLSATRETLAVAGVYFGVGALIGLLAQLRSDARKTQVVEDYGLSATRVHQLVIASGLAGVGGVVLMAIGADVTTTSNTGSELGAIFDVGVKPAPLLVAAVFGLSPSLLLDRIASKADTYKAELSTMQVGSEVTPAAEREAGV